jgi:hypothetical protein
MHVCFVFAAMQLFAGTNGLSRPKPNHKPSRELHAGRIAVPQPGWQTPPGLQPYSINQPAQQQMQQQRVPAQ